MKNKIERRYRKEIAAVRRLFKNAPTSMSIPMPRMYRAACRYLERRKELQSEDAFRRPGSQTVVRGYKPTRKETT